MTRTIRNNSQYLRDTDKAEEIMSATVVWLYFNMTRYMQSAGRTSPITGIVGRYDELLQLVRLIYCCTKRWQELNGEAATVPLNLNSIRLLEA